MESVHQHPPAPSVPVLDGLCRDDPGPDDPGPFALLHRPGTTGAERVEFLRGDVSAVRGLADISFGTDRSTPDGGPRQDVLAIVPYRQIAERGFECRDDGETVLEMSVDHYETLDLANVVDRLPGHTIDLASAGFDIDDETYADIVRRVLDEEIGTGAGSNFVVHRCFTGRVTGRPVTAALAVFRQLLLHELGAYWTFVVHTGTRTFVGASPERHVSLSGGTATMNPISGTYRYPESGPSVPAVLEFLADQKEAEELYMVVDEELKMMSGVCDGGATVVGPYLKEMARLAHTEYFLEGHSSRDPREVLHGTMFAPTVTGSPLENASRVLARHERGGRGYYSGVLALIGRDGAGTPTMDSAILIRTADIDASGTLSVGVGATLVRHSDPHSEVAETRAKVAALLAAAGEDPSKDAEGAEPAAPGSGQRLAEDPLVRSALRARNTRLSHYWFQPAETRSRPRSTLAGLRGLVVDADDTFTGMLAHHLNSLGCTADIVNFAEFEYDRTDGQDFVVLGPGPGDPRAVDDPKMATLHAAGRRLLAGSRPFLAVCLSHQILCSLFGLALSRLARPNQGLQREIDFFGRRERVGFYNTFTALTDVPAFTPVGFASAVELSRDIDTGEVHALRGAGFASVQFHPESLLTQNGSGILGDLLVSAMTSRADSAYSSVEFRKSG